MKNNVYDTFIFLAHTSTMQFTSLTVRLVRQEEMLWKISWFTNDWVSFIQNWVRIQNTTDWEIASTLASLKGEEFVADTNEWRSWEMVENEARSKADIVTSTSCSSVGSCSDLSSSS